MNSTFPRIPTSQEDRGTALSIMKGSITRLLDTVPGCNPCSWWFSSQHPALGWCWWALPALLVLAVPIAHRGKHLQLGWAGVSWAGFYFSPYFSWQLLLLLLLDIILSQLLKTSYLKSWVSLYTHPLLWVQGAAGVTLTAALSLQGDFSSWGTPRCIKFIKSTLKKYPGSWDWQQKLNSRS